MTNLLKSAPVQKMLNIAKWKISFTEKFLAPLALLAIRIHVGMVFRKH